MNKAWDDRSDVSNERTIPAGSGRWEGVLERVCTIHY